MQHNALHVTDAPDESDVSVAPGLYDTYVRPDLSFVSGQTSAGPSDPGHLGAINLSLIFTHVAFISPTTPTQGVKNPVDT